MTQSDSPPRSKVVALRNLTRSTLLGDRITVADTSATRRRGLLGRTAFHPGEGLWIVPCEAIHTVGMKFAIDVVYLDRSLKVTKTRTELVPFRVSGSLRAHSTLELPAGLLQKTGTRAGDQLALEPSAAKDAAL